MRLKFSAFICAVQNGKKKETVKSVPNKKYITKRISLTYSLSISYSIVSFPQFLFKFFDILLLSLLFSVFYELHFTITKNEEWFEWKTATYSYQIFLIPM